MIQRFALLSVLLHAGTAAGLTLGWHQSLTITAPELHVTLAGKTFSSARNAEARNSADPVSRNATEIMAQPRSTKMVFSVPTNQADAQTQSDQTPVSEMGSDTHLVNHLLAELRAAIDAQFIYPPLAHRHGWQGHVRVELTVEPNGHLSELRILSSSGYAILDRDALQTLTRIGSLPQVIPRLDGQSYRLQLPVVYRLIES